MKTTRNILTVVMAIAAIGLAVGAANAAVTEADLRAWGAAQPEPFRLLMVTSTGRDATSSNIADYNAFADAAADNPGSIVSFLDTEWRTLMNGKDGPMWYDNIGLSLTPWDPPSYNKATIDDPIFLLDGTDPGLYREYNNNAYLPDPPNVPINITEQGDTLAGTGYVWTGWRNTLGDATGRPGNYGKTLHRCVDDDAWRPNTEVHPVYAMSELLDPADFADDGGGGGGPATLVHDATVKVSHNHTDFNLSVFPGKAGFDDAGLDGSPDSGVFGDGTVLDYRFFDSPNDALRSYADGGAGLISNSTANPANVNGAGEHWAVVWTTNDPGTDFSGGDPANFPAPTLTFARAQNITGTIDISALESGSLYFPHGTFINAWSLDLVMSGAGQPDVLASESAPNGPGTNMAWISSFDFANAGDYDTITYTYTNTDTDGSRARFMGVILDGEGAGREIPEPATMAMLSLAVCGLGGYVRSSRVKSRGKRKRS